MKIFLRNVIIGHEKHRKKLKNKKINGCICVCNTIRDSRSENRMMGGKMFDDQGYTGGEYNEINHAWNR